VTDRLARALLERRHAALALLVLLAAWALWSARGLEARFDPEELVAVEPAVAEGRAIIEQAFGRAEPPIIVIVDSREGAAPIVSTDGLAFLHGLARGLEEVPGVTRVEGLTTSRVPTTGDEAETLDSLDEVDTGVPEEVHAVVEAEPERFPAGMLSVAGPVSFATVGGEGPLTAEQAERARAVLAEVPLLHRRLVSDDGRVAVLAVLAEEGTDVLEGVRAECARHTWGSARVEVSGLPAMRAALHGRGSAYRRALPATTPRAPLGSRCARRSIAPRATTSRDQAGLVAECSANAAPCGSMNCAMRPPGTSIGPLSFFAPCFSARAIAASRSFVST
jgi:hypothetical protein